MLCFRSERYLSIIVFHTIIYIYSVVDELILVEEIALYYGLLKLKLLYIKFMSIKV